ncbi:Uncharacterised protein [BD1-7 clade bacterium]|uniref:Uncharacterized protein n=1 Tax=BD1-7 clade bacterium TaxID=2029982 RepID=A0A5S9PMM8_9GAMM|nr:Uncharacterised protein [BD1-7 clade bacterium]CAA0105128.1 Uncharacterised protein [BD1-7 clade bacterium]
MNPRLYRSFFLLLFSTILLSVSISKCIAAQQTGVHKTTHTEIDNEVDKSVIKYSQLSKSSRSLPPITLSITHDWILITSPIVNNRYFIFFDRKKGSLTSFDTATKQYATIATAEKSAANKTYTHVVTAPLGKDQKLNDKYDCEWKQVKTEADEYQACALKGYSTGINSDQKITLEALSYLLDNRKVTNPIKASDWYYVTDTLIHQLRLMRVDNLKALPLIIQEKSKKNWLVLNRIEYQKTAFNTEQLLKDFKPIE